MPSEDEEPAGVDATVSPEVLLVPDSCGLPEVPTFSAGVVEVGAGTAFCVSEGFEG